MTFQAHNHTQTRATDSYLIVSAGWALMCTCCCLFVSFFWVFLVFLSFFCIFSSILSVSRKPLIIIFKLGQVKHLSSAAQPNKYFHLSCPCQENHANIVKFGQVSKHLFSAAQANKQNLIIFFWEKNAELLFHHLNWKSVTRLFPSFQPTWLRNRVLGSFASTKRG